MNSGQWRVTVLLLLLLGLETLRSQNVSGFFKGLFVNPLKQGSS